MAQDDNFQFIDKDGETINLAAEFSDGVHHLSVKTVEEHTLVNELFHRHTGVESTVAVASSAGDNTLEVANGALFSANDVLYIRDGDIETTFPTIISIATDVLTLDRPLDYAYAVGDGVEVVDTDIATDVGSLASPVSYRIGPHVSRVWTIHRLILSINHAAAATDDLFGDQAELTNGLVMRARISDQFYTFTNWKSNRDIRLDMFDVTYTDKAGPSTFGTHARGSFSRVGVTVRLDGAVGDYLEILNQDNLTGLGSFLINAQGHFR